MRNPDRDRREHAHSWNQKFYKSNDEPRLPESLNMGTADDEIGQFSDIANEFQVVSVACF